MNLSYPGKIMAFQNALIPYRNARNDYIIDSNREKYLAITNQTLIVCKKIWLTLNYKDKEKFRTIINEMEKVITTRKHSKPQIDLLINKTRMKIAINKHMLEKMEVLKNQGYIINNSLLKKIQNQINYNTKLITKKSSNPSELDVPLLNDISGYILMNVNLEQAKKMLNTSYSIKDYQERMRKNLKTADFWTLIHTSMRLSTIMEDISELSNSEKTIKLIKIIQSIIKENLRKKSKPYNDETYILWNECVNMMKTAKKLSQIKIPIEDDLVNKKKFKDFFISTREQNEPKTARNIMAETS